MDARRDPVPSGRIPGLPKHAPSLAQVNLLLLISLVLILGVGILTSDLPFYETLFTREIVLILVPALLFVLLLRLPWRETLRWRLPDLGVLGASVLIGAGGWLFDTWLGITFAELLGYSPPLPPDFFPTDRAQALVLFALLVVVAPVCEEVLFRGLIQRGYEQMGVRASILITGLLFALFHQSLAQGLAIIPIAILLSYLAWRTDSLPASILAHAVNNAPAALLLPLSTMLPQLGETPDPAASTELSAELTARLSAINPALCALPAAMLGGLLVVGGLWIVRRRCPPPPPLQHGRERRAALKPGLWPWLGRTWPLLIVVPLSLLVMGFEFVTGRFPEQLSMGRPVQWAAAPWIGPYTWRYEVRNILGESVGTIECALAPQETVYALTCSRQQSAYEAAIGGSVYFGGDVDQDLTAQWQRANLRLRSVDRQRRDNHSWQSFSAVPSGDAVGITLTPPEGAPRALRLPLPAPSMPLLRARTRPLPVAWSVTLIERAEWPWRFSALPFQGFYSAQAALLDPDPSEGDDPTLTLTSVVVYGAEPIVTPAGTFIAWRVEVGPERVAWYDVESPHTLVAMEDGIERWVLVSVE